MRILVFSDIPPHVVGGAETQAARLAQAWQSKGHQVLIAGHRTPTGTTGSLRTTRLKVVYSFGRALRALSFFISTTSLMLGRGRRHDLIYCRFMGEATLSLVVLKALRLLDTPIVSAPGAAGSTDDSDAAFINGLPASRWLVALVNRHCNGVNYIASGIRTSLRELGIKTAWEVYIPNGISQAPLRSSGPDAFPTKMIFVGRLVQQKGLDVLLKALAHLRDRGLFFHLDIIGEGPEEEPLKRLAATLGLSERISFQGLQSSAWIQTAMARAHIFVLPSRYEGLSNAALEALATGLPGVFTRCGGIDGYLDDQTGWVCARDDSNSLAKALGEALTITRPDWIARSQRCQQLVQRHFLLDVCANRHIEFFEQILKNPKSPVSRDAPAN